jgi:hypothetical protein
MSYLDTPIEATVSKYTPNYSPDQIKQIVYDIGVISKENERLKIDVGSFRKQLKEHKERVGAVKEYIKGMMELDNHDVDEHIKEIADLLDITLTKRYAVDITVTYRGEVDIAIDQDIEDLEDQVSFDIHLGHGEGWEIEIEEDEVNIKHEEKWWM